MKKFYTQFKLYFVAVLLLAFAGKANAEVTIDDIAGTYKFTATLTINDNEYADLLTSDFTFTIANNSGLQIQGFIIEAQSCYATLGDGQIAFNQQYMDPNGVITLSNTNGDYPYGNPPILPTWNVDDEGNITIPDFTVITSLNHGAQTAEIAAVYSNCVVTKQEEEPAPAISFAGTYTVTGTKMDYTNGLPPTTAGGTFTLSIDENGIVTAIAGYDDLSEPIGYGYAAKGTTEGNKFIISVENAALGVGAEYDVLGDVGSAYSGTYDKEGTITISYKDGEYSITDFSVWQFSWNTNEYTLKYYWSNMDIAKEDGEDPTPEPAVSFTGTYTVSGTQYYYNTDADVVSAETSFTLVIDEDGIVNAIAGYDDLSGPIGYGYVTKGTTEGNKFIISVENAALGIGAEYDVLGDVGSAYSGTYDKEGTIEISFKDGEYSITDFSVWNFNWNTSAYTLKYYWTGLTVTKISDEVIDGINAINAQPETGAVYNLQGQKVEKAQKGLYIINGKKVIVK